jgi:hypothetical protein
MATESAAMTEEEAAVLAELWAMWRNAYHVAFIDGVWRAKRFNDVTVVITADTAEELAGLIDADYAAWTSPMRSSS